MIYEYNSFSAGAWLKTVFSKNYDLYYNVQFEKKNRIQIRAKNPLIYIIIFYVVTIVIFNTKKDMQLACMYEGHLKVSINVCYN
jgi:hypothetical protein